MEKKHVVLVVRWPTGGIRTHLKYTYPKIVARGWRATLIAPPSDETNVLKRDLAHEGFSYEWQARRNVPLSLFASLQSVMSSQSVDVIHSHGLTSAASTFLLPKIKQKAHLVSLHDVFLDAQFRGVKGRLVRLAAGVVLDNATVIHSVSNDARENLLSAFPKLRKSGRNIICIPNGIEPSEFEGIQARDLRAELQLDPSDFVVGFLGRFMSQKGFRILIAAIGRLCARMDSPRRPVVVAVGDGGFIREDKALIQNMGLSEHFRFLPFVPRAAPTICAMDVVVMPSLWEASGLLAMEVLASGVPLIATSCIGLRETVRGTPSVVVPPDNADSLSEAIEQCIRADSGLRESFQGYAFEARLRYSSDLTAAAFVSLLDTLSES